jgi:hypothetical protein
VVRAKLTPTHAIDVGCQPYRAFQGGRFRVLLSCWDELGGKRGCAGKWKTKFANQLGGQRRSACTPRTGLALPGGCADPAIRVRSLTGQEELEFSKRVGTNLRLGDISA